MAKKTSKSKTPTNAPSRMAPAKLNANGKTKKQICIGLLKRRKGASLADLQQATGWQPHSVRGFLSGTVRKLEGVTLASKATGGGDRRYRIESEKPS